MMLDFRALKAAVSIERVLAARGVSLRRNGHRLVGPCPIHRGDNPGAFVVDGDRNLWYCFTGCGAGGDVLDLVRRLDGVGWREAGVVLAALAGPASPATPSPPERQERPEAFRPWVRRLDLDPDVPFLRRKGIRPETARDFEAGAWRGLGFLAGCIGVQLRDLSGQPLGYAGRRLDAVDAQQHGKWKLPPRLPRREILFAAHRIGAPSGPHVVVECAWGVMRLAQIGVPAVALLGTSLHEAQRRWLAGRDAVLLFDGDDAGRRAARRIAASMDPTCVRIADLPTGKDPDDLPDAELVARLRPFFPL